MNIWSFYSLYLCARFKSMNKTTYHTIQSRFALLLLVVFVGSLLIKPAHSLLEHHQHALEIYTTTHEPTVTTNHYKNCPICDFEFCSFIPQKQLSIPQTTAIVRNEQIRPTVDCLVSISSHHFQLRAPPAL